MIEFVDEDGVRWAAEIISHGRTSAYLNPRVHRPVLQFRCLDRRKPLRYLAYDAEGRGPVEERSDGELRGLLFQSKAH